jgi:hypothetical protein
MAVYSLFRNKPFEPEAISVLSGAYADICRALGLDDADRPETDAVARKVIEYAQRGVSDRVRLCERVLQELG